VLAKSLVKRLPIFLLAYFLVSHFIPFISFVTLELEKIPYLEVMKNLNKTDTKDRLRALFNRDYTYIELSARALTQNKAEGFLPRRVWYTSFFFIFGL